MARGQGVNLPGGLAAYGNEVQQQGTQMLGQAAEMQQRRESNNAMIRAQNKQANQALGTTVGAMGGMYAGMQIGSVGGPLGMMIGAAAGALFGSLF